jgi:hypothetical protein
MFSHPLLSSPFKIRGREKEGEIFLPILVDAIKRVPFGFVGYLHRQRLKVLKT